MKGVKVTLDTKVQPNLIDWRKLNCYDASKDVITKSMTSGYKDIHVVIPKPKINQLYTISFDAYGSTTDNGITTHLIPLTIKDIIAVSEGGIKRDDNGHVDWNNLSEKSKRYFVTYRCVEKAKTILIRLRPGTTYIRNVKLELCDHPTDYVDYQK